MTRVPPLALLAAAAFAMWLSAGFEHPAPRLVQPSVWRLALCLLLAAGGCAFAWAGVVEFRRAATTVDPRDPSKANALITAGVFRWSRNPMYVGFVTVLAAWGLYLDSLLALLFAALYFLWLDRLQIAAEERHIGALFGAAYQDYCARVRRWL